LTFDVRPVVAAQENVSALVDGLYYWEGAVGISGGDVSGRGYVELTGYGQGSRPAL
jgi:predicted secreted hydrolase